MSVKLLLDRIDEPGLHTLPVYEGRGGYRALRKALKMAPEEVLEQLEASGLRGRGGAGFAMGTKVSFLPKGDMDKYLVCNADESEPGTFKDRELMQKNPAHADRGDRDRRLRRGHHARVHLHPRRVRGAGRRPRRGRSREARAAGYLGERILGSGTR